MEKSLYLIFWHLLYIVSKLTPTKETHLLHIREYQDSGILSISVENGRPTSVTKQVHNALWFGTMSLPNQNIITEHH